MAGMLAQRLSSTLLHPRLQALQGPRPACPPPRIASASGAWVGLRGMCEAAGGFQRQRGQNPGEKEEKPQVDPKARMGIQFTCQSCETRVTRFFSKLSYERGVVIIKVEEEHGCKSTKGSCMHLIADNLGWFEDQPVNIETLMARRGEIVKRATIREEGGRVEGDGGAAGGAGGHRIVLEESDGLMEYRPEDEEGPTPLLK